MAQSGKENHAAALISTGALAWLVPGAGHYALKERRRAIVTFSACGATGGRIEGGADCGGCSPGARVDVRHGAGQPG